MAETKTPAQLKAEEEARKRNQEEEARKHAQASHAAGSSTTPSKPGSGGATVPGAMSTYSSKPPHIPPEEIPEMPFEQDEVKGLVGDVRRGQLAHIKLDPEGHPQGAAFVGVPEGDQETAPVYGTPTVQFDELVTPSGAPITKVMNPEQKMWDAQMLARNPMPEITERQKKFAPPGGGVINQPVTV